MLGPWLLRAAVFAFAVSACRSSGGAAGGARIDVHERGAELWFGSRRVELPPSDLPAKGPSVQKDDAGRRLAYQTNEGMTRVLYVVGQGLFLGPLVGSPVDFRAVPDLDHALGPLFEVAAARRAELVDEVRREKGDEGVVRLLIDAAYVDDPLWDRTREALPAAQQTMLRDALARGLEPGAPPALLKRAVRLVDLGAPSRRASVAARVKELSDGAHEPRAVAVLLRALAVADKSKAAESACDVLAKSRAAGDSVGDRGRLIEAATLAIASAGVTCPDAKIVEALLREDGCVPYLRCGESGPLSWRTTSTQNEPLCTKDQLAKAIEAELQRSPADVLESESPRPVLFAYAALLGADRVPASFIKAHTRRRYDLTQPEAPSCEDKLPPNTPCHCDEATLRLYACREPESSTISVGLCRFNVDDAQKKIVNVVATPPP